MFLDTMKAQQAGIKTAQHLLSLGNKLTTLTLKLIRYKQQVISTAIPEGQVQLPGYLSESSTRVMP